MFRVIKLFHVGDSTTKLSACVACASYFQHHGISLFISRHSEGKPSEPPFAEGKSPPFLPCCYAATGGLQERLAPRFVLTFVARLYTSQHDRPHPEPLPRAPPNRATLTPSALNQQPSHSYVVSLPDTTVGILPMSDAISIFDVYPPDVPVTVIPVLTYPVPSELYGGTAFT